MSSSSSAKVAPAPTVSLIHSPLLHGKDQFLGGECAGKRGHLYFIPGNFPQVLALNPDNDELRLIGPVFSGHYKWLRGVESPHNGMIYGLACHSDSILKINPDTDEVTTIPIPPVENAEEDEPSIIGMEWKYHGGTISPIDGKIYAIPQRATRVLCIDPKTDTITHVGKRLDGRCKWYGGLLGCDGCIYGMPQNAGNLLRINPAAKNSDDIVTLHGDFGVGGHKWHGGGATEGGKAIFAIPCNTDTVLRVNPPATPEGEPTFELLGDEKIVKTGRHRNDRKYKFLGAVADNPNGYVYFIPSGADRVLRCNIETSELEEVGPHFEDGGLERVHQNKWQNGFYSEVDKCVFAIPLNGDKLLRICGNGAKATVETFEPSVVGVEKWEGAVLAKNGTAYSCPNNYKGLLKIEMKAAYTEDADVEVKYQMGLPTLRSATHRVRYSAKKAKGREKDKPKFGSGTKGDADEAFISNLPMAIRGEHVIAYDSGEIDLHRALVDLLSDPQLEALLGGWPEGTLERRMEDFAIPPQSLNHRKGGQVAQAQDILSSRIGTDELFLSTFDRIVMEVVLPWLKQRLAECGFLDDETTPTTFYYQRPPTLRLQPGPSKAVVKPHCDSVYGHQDGELNFWLPLMDNELTGTYLWAETMPNKGDYHPLKVKYGEIASFHGSYCRHYVPANLSMYTRASIDFRVGIQGLFDPEWEMIGTRADHNRREVQL